MNILCIGEVLLRHSTKPGELLEDLNYETCIGGCETNIAVNLAALGHYTSLFSKIPDHKLGNSVLKYLRSHEVDTSKILSSVGRLGAYFVETGASNRNTSVVYDRAYSTMTTLNEKDFQVEKLLLDVDCVVVSGITLSFNATIRDTIMKILKYCKQKEITVCYDNNYRAKLWSIEDAGKAFKEVLPYVNVLSAGLLDAENFLNITSDNNIYEEQLFDVYQEITKQYPNILYITSTKREIKQVSHNKLQGYLFDGKLHVSYNYSIHDIVDRIGGGDAYFAAIIDGILIKEKSEEIVQFATCASVLKHSVWGDANRFSRSEIMFYRQQGLTKINR